MSESNPQSPEKKLGTCSTPTIGYRFHSGSEELGELQSEPIHHGCANSDSNLDIKTKPFLTSSGSLNAVKSASDKNELLGESVRDYWGLLGRSISIDSSYQSPFSNPIETWRKLNELKGKITKTVEEKVSEMKIDHSVSSHFKLNSSKESSSMSDSEDTSEASKLSEQWKDTEDLNMSLKEVINKTTDMLSNTLDAALQNAKSEMEAEAELRHRKNLSKYAEHVKIPNIRMAAATSDPDDSFLDESITEDIESGVEAEENLDSGSVDAFEDESSSRLLQGGSQTPPGGNDILYGFLSYFVSLSLSQVYSVAFLVGFSLYFVIPMSDFYRGFVFCLLTILFLLKIKGYLIKEDSFCLQGQGTFAVPDFTSLPPLKVPEYTPVKGVWMNEFEREYDPDYYSVSQTVPAYLELDNCILKLSRPKGKINKRATIDEPEYKLQFVNQRVFNISGCNVFLLPEGLTRKRLYSKKYPIVIFLRPDSFVGEKNMEEKENVDGVDGDDLNLTSSTGSSIKSSLYLFSRCDRQKEEWYRKLLAATRLSSTPATHDADRVIPEKKHDQLSNHVNNVNSHGNHGKHHSERENHKKVAEEQVNAVETPSPFEDVFFDPEIAQAEEYLRYMAKFVDVEPEPHREDSKKLKSRYTGNWHGKKTKKKKNGELDGPGHEESLEHLNSLTYIKKHKGNRLSRTKVHEELEYEENSVLKSPTFQVQWFNAFLNRILFDMFRSPYWLAKIHEKLYKKLNSIRLPYYVEDIEVIEMDLGKTGPMFHRVSQPYLDERGLWFDMDTTFEGLIKLTIQTHLNLVKLQKGMQEEEALKNALEKPEKSKKKLKETRDPFLMKDSHEKSKETINRTKINKKLEKSIPRVSKSSSADIEQEEQDDFLEKRDEAVECGSITGSKLSDRKLYKEVARIAEIALDPDVDHHDLFQRDLHDEAEAFSPDNGNERQRSKSPIYDSDVEDSAESSDEDIIEEEEEIAPLPVQPETEERAAAPVSIARRYPKNRRSSKKLFRMFENVAQSKYFKSVAQSKYIQKAIAGVSATKLKLTLEIKSVTGTLAVNIPPPPSDRFWYGFRDMPKLMFSANPKIGEKALPFSQIKKYLQRKILHEIKKAMVAPNMIDFVLPTSAPVRSSSSQQMDDTASANNTSLPAEEQDVNSPSE